TPHTMEITARIDKYETYWDSVTPTSNFQVDMNNTGGMIPNTTSETKKMANRMIGSSLRRLMCRSKFSTMKSDSSINTTKIIPGQINPRTWFLTNKRALDSCSGSCTISNSIWVRV